MEVEVRQVNATKLNLLIQSAGDYVEIQIKITHHMVVLQMKKILRMMIQVIQIPTINLVVIKVYYLKKTPSLRDQEIQIKTTIGMLILRN